jgi:hypothetical protein
MDFEAILSSADMATGGLDPSLVEVFISGIGRETQDLSGLLDVIDMISHG